MKSSREQSKNHNFENSISIKGQVWVEKENNSDLEKKLIQKFNSNIVFSKLLSKRNMSINQLQDYFNPKIKNILPDPNVFDGMEIATEKIVDLIQKKKKIGIFGDYDVDGSSATALLKNYFDEIGIESEFYIPDRQEEGYGPNVNAFKKLITNRCEIIITLDCGTTSINEIRFAKDNNIEVIIVDHHKEGQKLPDAFSIINPNKKKDNSKFKNLCATAVTFFLVISINRKLKKIKFFKKSSPNLIKFLDLVALATICDVMKLDLLNRAFVKQGLKVLNQTQNLGLQILCNESQLNNEVNDYHLGYILGPRINAGGRMGESPLAAKLLSTNEKSLAIKFSRKLNNFNLLRKQVEKKVENEASKLVKDNEQIICINSKGWHEGVIGIVASKLTEKFNRPSIVISEQESSSKASCRSVANFDIGEFIIQGIQCGIIESGGGHKMAGGFSIKSEKIHLLKEFVSSSYKKGRSDIIKYYDSEIKISSINYDLYRQIESLSPFGPGNSRPKFLVKDCFIKYSKIVGDYHFSCVLEDIYGNEIRGIAFNFAKYNVSEILNKQGLEVSVIASLQLNNWNEKEAIEFQIQDMFLC